MAETKTLKQKYSSLPKRILTSCIALASLALIIWLDLSVFKKALCTSICLSLIGAMVTYEFYAMAKIKGHKPFILVGILTVTMLIASIPLQKYYPEIIFANWSPQITIIIFGAMLTFFAQGCRNELTEIYADSGVTICGFIYIGLMGCFLAKIAWLIPIKAEQLYNGMHLLGLTILVIKSTDIGGFMIGAAIGKHKWIPKISPGKSVEGLIGGMLFATLITWVIGSWLWPIFPNLTSTIVFGLITSFCGQLADLTESMFKRAANQKDSGNTLPGFGGFFDLTDSLIAGSPIAYFLLINMVAL